MDSKEEKDASLSDLMGLVAGINSHKYQKKSVGNAQIIDDQEKNEAPEKMKDCTKSLVTQSREKQMQTKEPLSTGNDSDNESSYSDDSDLEKSMGNCCQGLSNKIRTVLRINVPTGDASQTNSNDEAKQRQPILNETPPIFGEESSSSETTIGFTSTIAVLLLRRMSCIQSKPAKQTATMKRNNASRS